MYDAQIGPPPPPHTHRGNVAEKQSTIDNEVLDGIAQDVVILHKGIKLKRGVHQPIELGGIPGNGLESAMCGTALAFAGRVAVAAEPCEGKETALHVIPQYVEVIATRRYVHALRRNVFGDGGGVKLPLSRGGVVITGVVVAQPYGVEVALVPIAPHNAHPFSLCRQALAAFTRSYTHAACG